MYAGRQGRILDCLMRMNFLVLDEHGFLPFAQSVRWQLPFHPISRYCEKISVVVTINCAFDEWPSVFRDARMTTALLSRINDYGEIHEAWNEIWRLRNPA